MARHSERQTRGVPPERLGLWSHNGDFSREVPISGGDQVSNASNGNGQAVPHDSQASLQDGQVQGYGSPMGEINASHISQIHHGSRDNQVSLTQQRIKAELKRKKDLAKINEERRKEREELIELEHQAELARISSTTRRRSSGVNSSNLEGIIPINNESRVRTWIEDLPASFVNFEQPNEDRLATNQGTEQLQVQEPMASAPLNQGTIVHYSSIVQTQPAMPMVDGQASQGEVQDQRQTSRRIDLPIQESTDSPSAAVLLQQREWRKTIGRDLPEFDGNCENWPEFLNRYRVSTAKCGFDLEENMSRLRRALKGKAKEAVKALMLTSNNPELIIETLQKKFGRPEHVIRSLLDKARQTSPPKEGEPEQLMAFSDAVNNFVAFVENLQRPAYLTNTLVMDEFVNKLSYSDRRRWGQHIGTRSVDTLTIKDFSTWLSQEALWIDNVRQPSFPSAKKDEARNMDKKPKHVLSTIEDGDLKELVCIFCEKKGHLLGKCYAFIKKSDDQRWNFIKEKGVCFCCLKPGHRIEKCFSKKVCGKDGCEKRHHQILHRTDVKPRVVSTEVGHARLSTISPKVLTKVLPVILIGPAGTVRTFALLDDGSEVTMIEDGIAKRLGLKGIKEQFQMRTANGLSTEESRRVAVKIKGQREVETFLLQNVRTIQDLPLRSQTVNILKLAEKWEHLRNVELDSLKNAKPTILIGQDNGELIVAEECVKGPGKSPILSRTSLGWVIHGSLADPVGKDSILQCHWMIANRDEELHQLVKESFSTESFGVKVCEEKPRTRDDRKAEAILEATTKRIGDRFETGLLWRDEDQEFPKSKMMAMRRLEGIERKMDRDANYAQQYCEKIDDYISKGYVRILSKEEAAVENVRTWYLPHFAVTNPNKPGKFRLVFDAAAKSQGMCFNDAMLAGPDLVNSLVGVLLKFRQKRIGFCGDIKEMFHQVRIREEDLPAQRFLWRCMNRDKPPDVMEMSVMIFGSACSPCCAQEVKNRNAREFIREFPEASKAIIERHYVDDYLDSKDSDDCAIEQIKGVIEVHRRGGFEICNWHCSSRNVLLQIPQELRAKENKTMSLSSELPTERVLGLQWNTNSDSFCFALKFHKIDRELLDGKRRPTKREVLRVVMSVYDPLGFLAHFTIRAKILMQDIWRTEIGWDDELSESLNEKWLIWLHQLEEVKDVQIPRHYSMEIPNWDIVELHVFADASEKAFSATAYFRFQRMEQVSATLVMARTRVAPLRPMSIPRLELQAAVMASRMAKTIIAEHDFSIAASHFWTDSKTVLCWLRSDARRFQMFVAHRVGEIEELTDIKCWHWVPSNLNVADDATRDSQPADLSKSSRWWNGPPFLLQTMDKWPKEVEDREENLDDLELKTVQAVMKESSSLPDPMRFSSWLKLLRSTAWMLRFLKMCRIPVRSRRKNSYGELLPMEYEAAEAIWWKKVQQDCFPEEIKCLQSGRSLPKNSHLLQLSPFLDAMGILRVKGRLMFSKKVSIDTSCPVILDQSHQFTQLLIKSHHEKAGHQGQEYVVNELRQRFWIPRLRTAVRKAWSTCQVCKNQRAAPQLPEMGNLPEARLQSFERPFMSTGVDYFGPMEVSVGRHKEKRYGVLFTCLTTRAVHLEIAASLSTDSCIMAIRRMISRRGTPQEIHSDNGTNFRGADKELKKALTAINQDQMIHECSVRGIDWHFNPPLCPHMGGSWERLIRSVKIALQATLKERSPKEETLQTLMAEVENIVNSRPLTHVSLDHTDDEALTPNHFLIGSSSGLKTFGNYVKPIGCLRKQWKIAQNLADHFWRRWLKEYLPTLTRRTKWHKQMEPIRVGDVVIIMDNSLPRNCWPRGIVIKVFQGRDGVVRVADIKTQKGIYRRSAVKLCVLDVRVKE